MFGLISSTFRGFGNKTGENGCLPSKVPVFSSSCWRNCWQHYSQHYIDLEFTPPRPPGTCKINTLSLPNVGYRLCRTPLSLSLSLSLF